MDEREWEWEKGEKEKKEAKKNDPGEQYNNNQGDKSHEADHHK